MSMTDWNARYDKARAELNEAKAQYRLAEQILAGATYRRDRAEAEVARLFHERMQQVHT
jgi:hypothetical protein